MVWLFAALSSFSHCGRTLGIWALSTGSELWGDAAQWSPSSELAVWYGRQSPDPSQTALRQIDGGDGSHLHVSLMNKETSEK